MGNKRKVLSVFSNDMSEDQKLADHYGGREQLLKKRVRGEGDGRVLPIPLGKTKATAGEIEGKKYRAPFWLCLPSQGMERNHLHQG